MKKKYRNITVDDQKYAWSIGGYDYDNGNTQVNLWKGGKIFHDFWVDSEAVTPKIVAEEIKRHK